MKSIILGIVLGLLATSPIPAQQWSPPVRISEHGGFSAPQILAQGDTLHVLAEEFNVTDKIGYWRSTDAGETWSAMRILSDDSCQTLWPKILRSDNRLMALWRADFNYGGNYSLNIGYSISNNNGQSWSLPRYVFNPNRLSLGYFAASNNGSVTNIVFTARISDSLVFHHIESTDFGNSWSSPTEIFRSLESGKPDQDNNSSIVHLTWDGANSHTAPWETHYVRSTDRGINWSSNFMLSEEDDHGSQIPAIKADSVGNVTVCWTDGKYSPYLFTGDILVRQSIDSGLTWEPERQASATHFAWGSDIALGTDTIHIVWVDEGSGWGRRSIYYAQSTDNGATWSEPYWIDGTLDDSADPALATSRGKVYLVWSDFRYEPDSSRGGLYLSYWQAEPNAIHEGDGNGLPAEGKLFVYPNPFNSSVSITYANLKGGEIKIYDIKAALVKALEVNESGEGKVVWDATDASGKKVCSGTYFASYGSVGRAGNGDSNGIKLIYLK